MSSSFVCERPRRLWTNSITVGTPARATSAASCSGPLGRRCDLPRDLAHGLVGELDQRLVEQDRLDRPDPLPLDLDVLLLREPPRRGLGVRAASTRARPASRWRWSSRQTAVSTTDVTIPGFVTTEPIVHTAPSPVRFAISRISSSSLRRGGERVTALIHRRRAGVRGLAAERDLVALDAEGAEHDAERQVRALRARAPARCAARGRRPRPRARRGPRAPRRARRRARRPRPAASTPVGVAARAQLVLVGHRPRGRGRPEQRAPEARALLVGPAHEPHGRRGRARPRPAAAAPRRPPMTFSDPSSQPPFGTESMCPPISTARSEAPGSVNHWLPAASHDLLDGTPSSRERSQPRARSHVSVQATRCAPFSSPVSSRARGARRPCAKGRVARGDDMARACDVRADQERPDRDRRRRLRRRHLRRGRDRDADRRVARRTQPTR